jgi:lysosomal Pro-X carboxypeptidase
MLWVAVAAATATATYETKTFAQRLDHFRSDAHAQQSWPQRYLIDRSNWKPGGPILFYTGNEGPVEAFFEACGFITTVLAPRLNGLVLFAEQRFYGHSMPLGSAASADSLSLLSTEQVLADYAVLLSGVRASLNATSSPVVAFGGSYGGTLATLFRLKYPHLTVGALASSAPIGYYSPSLWLERGVDEYTWFRTVERVYAEASAGCYGTLVAAVAAARDAAASSAGGERVAKAFGLCSAPSDASAFSYWITEALESIPQIDYPYSVGTLPANPVNATCAAMARGSSDGDGLEALGNITKWFYGSGDKCTPEEAARSDQVGGGVPGDGPEPGSSWGYQSCTETLHAFSVPEGSWRSYKFDPEAIAKLCDGYYGVTPRKGWLELWSGGYAIGGGGAAVGSNIIWSNGRRDPWHGGGFLRQSDALPGGAVFVMEHTAHHQDLRAPHAADPAELHEVRAKEEAIIRKWISDASR